MVNVLYLAVLLGSVYGIGQRLGGPIDGKRVGLLAAFVVATLPMIYAISRFYYLELALTAMVALSIYLLLASDRFENRAISLLFGLGAGLGLLTKRTYLTFMIAPMCLVVVRSGALRRLRERLRNGFHIDVKDALLALGLGLVMAAVWYLPAREVAKQLPLGPWLLPLWAGLAALTIYLLRRSPGPDTNFLSALFLGATIGSLWYLPRVTFVQRLLSFGFGINDPRDRSAGLGQLSTYLYFPVRLINEHISLVTFAFLILAVLGLLIALRHKGSIWSVLWRANDAWWVTALWLVGGYLILTLSIYRKSRGIAPVLPALALLLAAGLFRLPWKRVVTALVVLIIFWGLLQFFVLSYEGPHWLAERTAFKLPVLGDTGVFAQGGTLQLPATGETEPGYWIVPEVLRMTEAGREAAGAESIKLGVLVNNDHLNPDLLGLVALQSYPGLQIRNLARTGSADSVYPQLFEQDFLLLIDGDYLLIDSAAQEALRHLAEAPELFEATFELAKRFPLPDGDTALLYRKVHQLAPGYEIDDYRSVVETVVDLAGEEDAILLVPPGQVEALGRTYNGDLTPYLLPQQEPLDPVSTARALEGIITQHPVLFAIFRRQEAVDPERFIEGWLNEHAYRSRTEWHDGVQLLVYGSPLAGEGETLTGAEGNEAPEQPLDVSLGEQIKLLGHSLTESVIEPGGMVRLTLFWRADSQLAEQYTVFAHLLDGEGRLIAQQDNDPVGGSRPTTTWKANEMIRDRLGILIPSGAASGEYQLVVGVYQPGTGQRLPVFDQDGELVGDSVPLTVIRVREP
jgi:4-amino-4-deoxy-L-arabinose transferase-like glycosyltransferase